VKPARSDQALRSTARARGELTTADSACAEPREQLGREAEPVLVVVDRQQLVAVPDASCPLLDWAPGWWVMQDFPKRQPRRAHKRCGDGSAAMAQHKLPSPRLAPRCRKGTMCAQPSSWRHQAICGFLIAVSPESSAQRCEPFQAGHPTVKKRQYEVLACRTPWSSPDQRGCAMSLFPYVLSPLPGTWLVPVSCQSCP
jgi:hypothetical protein